MAMSLCVVGIHIGRYKRSLLFIMINDSDNLVRSSHVTYTLHDPAIHLPSFHNSNNIWWQVQFMKLYIMQFYPIPYYFQP